MSDKDMMWRLDPQNLFEMTGHEKILASQLILIPSQRRKGDQRGEVIEMSNLGMFCFEEGRDEEAIMYLSDSCAMAEKLEIKDWLVRTLVNLGVAHRYGGSQIQALKCYMRAWQLAVDVPVPECIYTSGSNIMILVDEEVCGDIPEKTLAAIELKAEQYGFQGLASNIARLRGEMLIRSGRRREADQIFDRAIRNFAADDPRCSAEIEEIREGIVRSLYHHRLLSKAHEYIAAGRPLLAKRVFDRIMDSLETASADVGNYLIRLRISIDCMEFGLWRPACEYLSGLRDIALQNGNNRMVAEALRFLCDAQLRLDELELAWNSANDAMRMWVAEGSLIGEAVARFYMGGVLVRSGRVEESRRQTELCKTLLEKDGSPGAVGIWNGFAAGRTPVFRIELDMQERGWKII